MPVNIVFETHSFSEDNEAGIATGWLPGRLSVRGREVACELGERRSAAEVDAVFSSDLRRAAETAELAFADDGPILLDWRLRECDYGAWNGSPVETVHGARLHHLDDPYPGGESWRQAVARVARFLDDLPTRWAGRTIVVIGHVATRWALEHHLRGVPLETLAGEQFTWQPGWEYTLA